MTEKKECDNIRLYNLFELLTLIVWLFVLTAFIFKDTALLNIFIVIPLIYILHIMPFHIFEEVKHNLCPNEYKKSTKNGGKGLYHKILNKSCDYCFKSPITIQGFLIFGMITSVYSLYIRGNITI